MAAVPVAEERRLTWVLVGTGAIRAAFGILWAVDAYLTWQEVFPVHYVGYLQNAAHGQPEWLAPWFAFWIALVTPAVGIFVLLTRLVETGIAIGLLLGLARKWVYVVGAVFSLLLWSTAEGFGGPYAVGAANLGPALVYVLVFAALLVLESLEGTNPYSLDYYIERRRRGWGRVAEAAPPSALGGARPRLTWPQQAFAIAAMVLAFLFFLGTLQSALSASPATPANAAAAVSPLSIASSQPQAEARNAGLPPLIGTGDTVSVTITSTDTNVQIANGVSYQAWTFDGTVPGPVLHVRQGQTVNVTFVNKGMMQHSIDFHAAEVAPSVAYQSVNPGQSLQFSFTARVPGAFVYHCGTPPVLMHIGNGMYGAIVVDPAQPLPNADASYVIVQGEWYTKQVQDKVMGGDYNKMMALTPDEVVFNGFANQYKDHPLQAKVGQRIRFYVVDAGPNLPSAFHVIGGIFSAVYPDGDAAHALAGVSTYEVGPGAGAVMDITFQQPGQYPFVDHSMRDMMIGAVGVINVTQ